jgi:hypothetical protein
MFRRIMQSPGTSTAGYYTERFWPRQEPALVIAISDFYVTANYYKFDLSRPWASTGSTQRAIHVTLLRLGPEIHSAEGKKSEFRGAQVHEQSP